MLAGGVDVVAEGNNSTLYFGFTCGVVSRLCTNAKPPIDLKEEKAVLLRLFKRNFNSSRKADAAYEAMSVLLREAPFRDAVAAGAEAVQNWMEAGGAPIVGARALADLLGVPRRVSSVSQTAAVHTGPARDSVARPGLPAAVPTKASSGRSRPLDPFDCYICGKVCNVTRDFVCQRHRCPLFPDGSPKSER
jgi:hypothetical protein